MKKQYHLIGACSGWGAQLRGCEQGPEMLLEHLDNASLLFKEIEMIYPQKRAKEEYIPPVQSLPLIHDLNLQLFTAVRESLKKEAFPIVLGGDHSIAVGTWNAFESPFGLLWIDAHMDAHTTETTPSGAYHGMPLAALLGYGAPEMSRLIKKQPVIKPQNLALIGVRSFEKEELALFEKLNVKIYFMDEVRKRGLKTILPEAIAHITRDVNHYGISLDLDVFSPEDAPGVGSPEDLGIRKEEFLPLISHFSKDDRWMGFEMVEFNPERDINQKTCNLALSILKEIVIS